MQLKKTYTNYLLLPALCIEYWEDSNSIEDAKYKTVNPWQGEFRYKNTDILLEKIVGYKKNIRWLFPLKSEISSLNWFLNKYLIDLQENNLDFPSGGIYIVDTESREVVGTNYDIGESEKWEIIFEEIKSNRQAFHTFPATDQAIELKIIDGDIWLQNLNWEAIPNRIETSRQIEPIHIFKESNNFLKQLDDCIAAIKSVYNEIEKGKKENKDLLMSYFSVDYRSILRMSDDDWINS